jgi:hypothetical protein
MSPRHSEASDDDDLLVYSAPDIDSYHPEIDSSPSLHSLADKTEPSRRGRARAAASFAHLTGPRSRTSSSTLYDEQDEDEDDEEQMGLELATLNKGANVSKNVSSPVLLYWF